MTTQLVIDNDNNEAGAYHHGDLRQALMDAACEQIDQYGTEKLSLRALARDAGVSPTAPYRHFPSKNCLLASIAVQGFQELGEKLEQDIARIDGDCLEHLTASGHTYVNYAVENPAKFHLMFGDILADFTAYQGLQQAANETFEKFMDLVKAARDAGLITNAPFDEVAAYVWSSMHGAASLIINKARKIIKLEKELSTNSSARMPASMIAVKYMQNNLDGLIQRVIRGLMH